MTIAIMLFGLPALIMTMVLAMTGTIKAGSARGALIPSALLGLGCAAVSAWLWRVGFQRAEAGLPASPWTDLWLLLAVDSAAAVVSFFSLHKVQARKRQHR